MELYNSHISQITAVFIVKRKLTVYIVGNNQAFLKSEIRQIQLTMQQKKHLIRGEHSFT